jgi:nicotinamidase-related amidase
MVDRCAILLQASQELGIPAMISEQYRKGLGATVERLDNAKGNAQVMEKMHFSCASDPAMAKHVGDLASAGRDQLVVAGIESHVCVLQSVLDFRLKGLDVFVVGDAVTSRHPQSVAFAFERMRGAGIQVVTTEMALFEWLHVAGTPVFKTLSKLIK